MYVRDMYVYKRGSPTCAARTVHRACPGAGTALRKASKSLLQSPPGKGFLLGSKFGMGKKAGK